MRTTLWLVALSCACSEAALSPRSNDAEGSEGALTSASLVGDEIPELTWERSLPIGRADKNGIKMGGTEIRALHVFNGSLFAAGGYWMDRLANDPDLPGAQVFRLDRPIAEGGRWEVDLQIQERMFGKRHAGANPRRYHTISAISTARFETNQRGEKLKRPVNLLVVGVWDDKRGLDVFVRDTSGPESWRKSTIVPSDESPSKWHVRSFHSYRDKVTGADMLLVGTSGKKHNPRGIFHAFYDEKSGQLQWERPREAWVEHPGVDDRVMAFAEANGRLFATVCGKLYERVDGRNPQWKRIFQHPKDSCKPGPGEFSFRGLTTVRNGSTGKDRLLFAMEGISILGSFDFAPLRFNQELELQPFLRSGMNRAHIGYTIAAYNGFAKVELPNGKRAHFIGMEAWVGVGQPDSWRGWDSRAWYIIRTSDSKFHLRQIPPQPGERDMVATRTMLPSPFPSEKDKVVYAGGFDGNHEEGIHNTGWLYRGTFK